MTVLLTPIAKMVAKTQIPRSIEPIFALLSRSRRPRINANSFNGQDVLDDDADAPSGVVEGVAVDEGAPEDKKTGETAERDVVNVSAMAEASCERAGGNVISRWSKEMLGGTAADESGNEEDVVVDGAPGVEEARGDDDDDDEVEEEDDDDDASGETLGKGDTWTDDDGPEGDVDFQTSHAGLASRCLGTLTIQA